MRSLGAITILLLVALVPCLAQKVTVDPNASPTPAAKPAAAERYDPAKDPDKRMAKKLSYEATHSRLSIVVAEIAQKTGVIIKCGTSKNDWQSRDIPLTIYVKDLPLGTLLRALAHATHTVVRTVKLDDGLGYQICHSAEMSRALADYEPKMEAYRRALGAADWDGFAQLKDIPGSQLRSTYEAQGVPQGADSTLIKKISALVSALGSEYRERALNCEWVDLSVGNVPEIAREPLRQVIRASEDANRLKPPGTTNPMNTSAATTEPLSDEQIDKVAIVIRPRVTDHPEELLIGTIYDYLPGAWTRSLNSSMYVKWDSDAWKKLWPPMLAIASTMPALPKDDSLALDLPGTANDDLALLKRKIDLQQTISRSDLTCPLLALEVAKRAGFSVIIEDWSPYWHSWQRPALQPQIEVGQVLRGMYRDMWRIDELHSLVVANPSSWEHCEANMVPAAILDNLRAKMDRDGADFEDVLPIEAWTSEQFLLWTQPDNDGIGIHCRIPASAGFGSHGNALWRFYSTLSAEDRALTSTDTGLPLAKFDGSFIFELVKQENKELRAMAPPGQYASPFYGRALYPHPISTEAKALEGLTLRLDHHDTPYLAGAQQYIAPEGRALPRGLDYVTNYSLVLSNRTGQLLELPGPRRLPFYSTKRMAELLKGLTITATHPAIKDGVSGQ